MALKFLNNGYFAGKVGIGTDSLSSKLTISGQQELLQLTRGGASDSKWFFATDSAKLYIGENTSYGTGVKMTLTDAGNVGIGTTSPAKKLEISSGTNGDGILLTGNGSFSNGDSRNIEFSYSDTDTSYASAIKFEVKDATVHGGQIGFFTDAGPS